MAFEPVIGIEVHAQLKTQSKLFCGCSTAFGSDTNTNVCPVCLGLPGTLPVLNEQVVALAIRAGLALNCRVQHQSVFARKNYFYPDLPKGYQISQYDLPICTNGYLEIEVEGKTKRIGITRIHIEEDAGKLLHQGAEAIAGSTHSLSDLNRAATPLIEIVSEPDIRSPLEARLYVEKLKLILEYADICDGNMDEGSLRADANISIRPAGTTAFGTRTEVKNVNSFRSIEKACASEIERQTALVVSGGTVVQQTRHFDDFTQTTKPLRSKETAQDYRYFPEPDLLPLLISEADIDTIRHTMPVLVTEKIETLKNLGFSVDDITTLVFDREMLAYLDAVLDLAKGKDAKGFAKWILGDLNALLKNNKQSFGTCPLQPGFLIELVDLVDAGTISGKMAKDLLAKAFETGKSPKALHSESGATLISDTDALTHIVQDILNANPDVVEKIKAGKTNSADFLMGQVMKATRGQAKPDVVRELILRLCN
ncbi:MAG: Asp-tRNA(Asn)/Glu-tRNA(Gln) amidotransferase subunit GatB [Candidatus Margulisiibacteriota bacterium]